MAHHVALFTFGLFIELADHPKNDGFYARNDPTMKDVERATGSRNRQRMT